MPYVSFHPLTNDNIDGRLTKLTDTITGQSPSAAPSKPPNLQSTN